MPREPLPISGLSKNIDETAMGSSGANLIDCYLDATEQGVCVMRRPGLVELTDLGTSKSVDGLYWWTNQSLALAVSDTKTYKITASDGTFAQITGDAFQATTRPMFDNYGTNVYGANGEKIQRISTSVVDNMDDADAPTAVTHVAVLDRYLIANEVDSGNFHYSDVGAPTTWSGNYAEAEGRPDNLNGLHVKNLELILTGPQTIEAWHDDGVTPFRRLLQGFIESGTPAPYSVTWCGEPVNGFCFIDRQRQVVRIEGRAVRSLSDSLDKYVQTYSTIDDALGDFIVIQGHSFYVLSFPTEAETLVYDFTTGMWYQWAYYSQSAYGRWKGNSHCLASEWGKVLIGDRSNGKVYELSPTTYTDDGDAIRALLRTGHVSRGDSGLWKRCVRMDFRAKKVGTGTSSNVVLYARYRDNGGATWNSHTVTLVPETNGTDYIGHVNRLGRYKTRQWEIYSTSSVPVNFYIPVETYEFTA